MIKTKSGIKLQTELQNSLVENKLKTRKIPGVFLVTIGSIIISFSPILVRVSNVEPTMAGFYRSLFGGLSLLVIVMIKRENFWINMHQIKLVVASAFFFSLGLTFWHHSIHIIGPGISTILANLQVFFLAAMAMVFLKERLSLRVATCIPLAIVGICLLVGLDKIGLNTDYRTGVLFGLSAAFVYACYLMVFRKLQANQNLAGQLVNLTYVSLFCAVVMSIEALIQGETFIITGVQNWSLMIVYGVVCQALGWILISVGLPHIPASRAGLILLLQPTGAFIWDVLFFSRTTSLIEFFGAGLALTAIYFGNTKK